MINELEKQIKFVLKNSKVNTRLCTTKDINELLIIFIYAKYLNELGKIEIEDKINFGDFFEIAEVQKRYEYTYQIINNIKVVEIISSLKNMTSINLIKELKERLLKNSCYQNKCKTLVYHQFYSLYDYPICDQSIDFMFDNAPGYCNYNIIRIFKILDQFFSYHRKYYMDCAHLGLTQDEIHEYKKIYLDCNLCFSYRYYEEYRDNIFRLFRFMDSYLKKGNSIVVKVNYAKNTRFDYKDIFEHLSLVEIESRNYILHFCLKNDDKIKIKKENNFVCVTSDEIQNNYNRFGVNLYKSKQKKKYNYANKLIDENSYFSKQLHYISEEIETEINKLIEKNY